MRPCLLPPAVALVCALAGCHAAPTTAGLTGVLDEAGIPPVTVTAEEIFGHEWDAFAVHDDEVTLWRGAETKRVPLNDSMVTFDGHDIPRSDMDAELTFDNEGRWIYVDGSFAAAASAARSAISAG